MKRDKAPHRPSLRSRGSLSLSVLGLLDPLTGPEGRYDLRKDTSHLLLLEFFRRGHSVYVTDPSGLGVVKGKTVVRSRKASKILPQPPYFEFERTGVAESSRFDLILMRKDPPVDSAFLQTTQLLSLVPKPTWVCNSPEALARWNEKLIILQFPRWIPPTAVTSDPEVIAGLAKKGGGGVAVLKSLTGFGGKGTRLATLGSKDWHRSIATATDGGRTPVMAQAFLPAIAKGDKRIFLFDGKPLGALLRIPARGDFLANPDLGASLKRTTLTPREKRLCDAIGPFLRQNGLFFAGADVIDGKLTEINITSPGMLWEWNETDGVAHEREIVDLFERKLKRS